MWIEPKTDWTRNDFVQYSDYNRIKNNVAYLKDLFNQLYASVDMPELSEDKTYVDFAYADEFNAIEESIDLILNNSYPFTTYEMYQWFENRETPNFDDLNRIESACLALYEGMTAQKTVRNRLAIRLGVEKGLVI